MDYEKQAQDFLDSTATTFKAKYSHTGFYFDGDTHKRDIYNITLTRGERCFTFTFGNSLVNSGEYRVKYNIHPHLRAGQPVSAKVYKQWRLQERGAFDKNPDYSTPTPYDVLACLTKYDPGTFEDFCSEFGYDVDSRKAEGTYKAVVDEYRNLKMLYSDAELKRMGEIV